MTEEQVLELAKIIVDREILTNWQVYILIISLSLIGNYMATFITSYAKKRGENLATKADIDEIKKQLASTTEITTKIKNDIEHQVWRKQQIEIIKRNKIEEYLQYIYIAQENLSKKMNNAYFKTTEPIDEHAMSKSTMLQKLYFPELKEAHSIFLTANAEFLMWFSEGLKELVQKQQNREQMPIISTQHMEKYSNLLNKLNYGTSLIEAMSEKISEGINAS
jgi:hypothetical protein